MEKLSSLGARYMTLTHTDTLSWADSGTDEARNGGLTPFALTTSDLMRFQGYWLEAVGTEAGWTICPSKTM